MTRFKRDRSRLFSAVLLAGVMTALLLLVGPAVASGPDAASRLEPVLRAVLQGQPPEGIVVRSLREGQDMVEVIIQASRDASTELAALGAAVRSVIPGSPTIITADVPVAALLRVARLPSVLAIESSQPVRRLLDESVAETRAPQVWAMIYSQQPIMGHGVILAVVDSGIDWRHDDFKDAQGRSRILFLWDQTIDGAPPSGFNYGSEWTQAQINAGQPSQVDDDGHGTHVASIAASNGRSMTPPRFVGMAPEADLIIVKDKGTTAAGVDAWNYIVNKARSLGKPVVINNSWGRQSTAHDGRASEEVALDQLSTNGVIMVVSAGNDGDRPIHASGTVPQGQSVITRYRFTDEMTRGSAIINAWYAAAESMSTSVATPGGQTFGPVAKGAIQEFTASDGTRITVDARPWEGNPDNWIWIQMVKPEGQRLTGEWSFTLRGDQVTAGGRFDAWLQGGTHGGEEFTTNVDQQITLGSPGTAREAIVVGSYVTKPCWDSKAGRFCYQPPAQDGGVSPFSSLGPTRDGREKPDISAPGQAIIGALSGNVTPPQSYITPDGKHQKMQGTSQAAPHVAGAVALMLQVSPTLDGLGAINVLRSTARTDGFTGTTWNAAWGKGKLNAQTAVQSILPGVRDKFVYLPIVARNLIPGQPLPTPTPTATATPGGATPTRTPTPTSTPTETPQPGEVCDDIIVNGGFEQGLAPWQQYSSGGFDLITTEFAYAGSYAALLGDYDLADEQLWQIVDFPANLSSASLAFFYVLQSSDVGDLPQDTFAASILSSDGTEELVSVARLNNTDVTAGWVPAQYPFSAADLAAVAGQQAAVFFAIANDEADPTLVALDEVSLEVCRREQ